MQLLNQDENRREIGPIQVSNNSKLKVLRMRLNEVNQSAIFRKPHGHFPKQHQIKEWLRLLNNQLRDVVSMLLDKCLRVKDELARWALQAGERGNKSKLKVLRARLNGV